MREEDKHGRYDDPHSASVASNFVYCTRRCVALYSYVALPSLLHLSCAGAPLICCFCTCVGRRVLRIHAHAELGRKLQSLEQPKRHLDLAETKMCWPIQEVFFHRQNHERIHGNAQRPHITHRSLATRSRADHLKVEVGRGGVPLRSFGTVLRPAFHFLKMDPRGGSRSYLALI